MASHDQITFSLQGVSDLWAGVLAHARGQGCVYFLLNEVVELWLAARPEGWRIHAFNLVVFALSAPCFALALFQGWRERLLYVWLFASVSWAGLHHLPLAFLAFVQYEPIAVRARLARVRDAVARAAVGVWRWCWSVRCSLMPCCTWPGAYSIRLRMMA
ncbi:MAG: hypothetical protein RL685_989 [Pseudomonadota bacterium]